MARAKKSDVDLSREDPGLGEKMGVKKKNEDREGIARSTALKFSKCDTLTLCWQSEWLDLKIAKGIGEVGGKRLRAKRRIQFSEGKGCWSQTGNQANWKRTSLESSRIGSLLEGSMLLG